MIKQMKIILQWVYPSQAVNYQALDLIPTSCAFAPLWRMPNFSESFAIAACHLARSEPLPTA